MASGLMFRRRVMLWFLLKWCTRPRQWSNGCRLRPRQWSNGCRLRPRWLSSGCRPPVVVERRPSVVYEGPVVVERRSVDDDYRPSYQYHSYYVETGRDCYGQRSLEWEDDVDY